MDNSERNSARDASQPFAGMDDDAFLAELRRVATEIDGVPGELTSAVQAALTARDLDGELALLVRDTRLTTGAAAGDPVRADAGAPMGMWLLSFQGGGVRIDMQVGEDTGGRVRLIGQLGGAVPHDCRLESADGERCPLEVDDLGRFTVGGVPHGPVRLRCTSSGGLRVTTAWVAV